MDNQSDNIDLDHYYDENYDFESEFNKIKSSFINKLNKKDSINRNENIELDVRDLEEFELLYEPKIINEEEYIEIIKNSDKFFFDDYKKINEDDLISLKENKEEKPNFEIICYFKFNYYRKRGIFEDYDHEKKIVLLKNKFDNKQLINIESYYLYGKIKDYSKKDDFRKNMELFLKCSSIVVKRKKIIDNNNNISNNEKLIKELNDNDEDEDEEISKVQKEENKEDIMDEKKIEFINSIITKKIK